MEDEFTRPAFLASYFEAMREKYRTHGKFAIVPIWLLFCMACGSAVAYAVQHKLWTDDVWDVSIGLYGSLLTVNGLILAVSWNAFARIHGSILSSPGFSTFLKQGGMLNVYLFYIDYVQAAQLFALFTCAIDLFSVLVELPNVTWDRTILAASLGLSGYAIKYGVNAVTVMHDLVWQKAIFDEQEAKKREA